MFPGFVCRRGQLVAPSNIYCKAYCDRLCFSLTTGMMDAAYFTGRKELLDFFNDLLDLNLSKIEQTASGAVACQLTEYIFPGSIPMQRVNWEARSNYEFVQNYKLLQAAFNKHGIKRHVDVDKLINAKYQDNLEFCQWLKAFFDQRGVYREDYDPVAARAKGKGGLTVHDFLNKTAPSHGSKPLPRSRPTGIGSSTARPSGTTTRSVLGTSSAPPTANTAQRSTSGGSNPTAKQGATTRSTDPATEAVIADATLMRKNDELKQKVAELEQSVVEMERERDFYFEKLRNVEVMVQVYQEKGEGESDAKQLVDNILKVLYATADDQLTVNDDGQVGNL